MIGDTKVAQFRHWHNNMHSPYRTIWSRRTVGYHLDPGSASIQRVTSAASLSSSLGRRCQPAEGRTVTEFMYHRVIAPLWMMYYDKRLRLCHRHVIIRLLLLPKTRKNTIMSGRVCLPRSSCDRCRWGRSTWACWRNPRWAKGRPTTSSSPCCRTTANQNATINSKICLIDVENSAMPDSNLTSTIYAKTSHGVGWGNNVVFNLELSFCGFKCQRLLFPFTQISSFHNNA